MALILHLETSTEICSVSIAENGALLHLEESTAPNSHASLLAVLIQQCIQKADKSISQLDAIAVASGPGSYTSLRIGVATAKGLCYASDLPMITLDSLLVLAEGIDKSEVGMNDVLIPMIDARRMEVYASVYDKNLRQKKPLEAIILENDTFGEYANEGAILHVCGNGAPKFVDQTSVSVVKMHHCQTSSVYMLPLASEAYEKKQFADIASFTPLYFKEPHITVSKKKYFSE